MSEMKCCSMCGSDTSNKCGICRRCFGGRVDSRGAASSVADTWADVPNEMEDFSEESLGPWTSDRRASLSWEDE